MVQRSQCAHLAFFFLIYFFDFRLQQIRISLFLFLSSFDYLKMENEKEDGFIKTTTHNYVSRKATIDGAKQVEIKGRSIIHDVKIRGDLVSSFIGFTASLCLVLAWLLRFEL